MSRHSTAASLIALLAGAGSACSGGGTPPPLAPSPIAVPAPANASEPHVTASAKGPLLSWVEQQGGTATLRFAERNGSTWSAPATVASGSDWFLSAADVPSVLRLANGTIAAAWYRSTNVQFEAYDTWLAHSSDEGRIWSAPVKPYSDTTTTQHGFATLFDQPGGGLGLVWLDAREWELNQDAPDGGSVMLRSASFDTSWKQTSDILANLRVCDCCQTSVAITSDGAITAFRDRTDDDIRDIAVTSLKDGQWTPAINVHEDGWELDSCPVNGPAISANGRTVVVSWFTAVSGAGHSYAAFSPDAGATWGAAIRLDAKESTGHVDVELLPDGSAVATWIEFADGRARLKARRIRASGDPEAAVDVQAAQSGRVSGFPRMARVGNDLYFVWAESTSTTPDGAETAVQIKAAVARLAR